MQPLISIITPNYNAEKFIEETLQSVINQTYENWEMLIIDDCSTDNSISIIEKFLKNDKRIKLIRLNKNSGPAVARNTAIKVSKGDYIAFLDSDDRWEPTKLTKQLEFMISNNYRLSFTSYTSVSEQKTKPKLVLARKEVNYYDLLTNNYIGCLTAMYSVKQLGKVYFPKIERRQDWALWLKITKQQITAYGLQVPLASYTRRDLSISSNKWKLIRYNWTVYRKFEKINFFKSVYLILVLTVKKFLK